MITQNLSTLKIHKMSKAQYDRELAAGRIDENAIYLVPDDDSPSGSVEAISADEINAICGTVIEFAEDVKL